jgi:hypothetical protein
MCLFLKKELLREFSEFLVELWVGDWIWTQITTDFDKCIAYYKEISIETYEEEFDKYSSLYMFKQTALLFIGVMVY